MSDEEGKIGAVMVVGGGIAGMQAALDLADTGYLVYVIDSSPSIGGAMAQLDKTFPTHDCAMCILSPKLVATGRHHNVKLMMASEIDAIEGEPGNFTVSVKRKARYVDEEKCTGCGLCTLRCPVEVRDEYNQGLKLRKAIYLKYPQAVPPVLTIDRDNCIGCGVCETQCVAGAINFSREEELVKVDIGSVILAPGFSGFDPGLKSEYGYGVFKNVLSSVELERMLSATGPYRGMVLRPSDGRMPKRMAFIQCVGSRDVQVGNPYCSSVCCMFAIKEAIIAKEHTPGLETHIFFMDMRAFGKEFDEYYIRAEEEHRVVFTRNTRVSSVSENPETNNLHLWYSEHGKMRREEYDIVVLSVGFDSPKDVEKLAEKLGIELNEHGFCQTDMFTPLDTSKPGIYVCGAFSSPKDIPDSVAQASGAACRAMSDIAGARGALVTAKEYPPEIDVSGQEPKVGVFVCHCGINIGGVLDVPSLVEYAKTLPNVVHAEDNLYTCSQDTQQRISETVREKGLNRVVVASCTPRTHTTIFQNTLREAGLNPYLFEMTNIRDQCSWVHMNDPERATEKGRTLIRMAVAKAALLEQLRPAEVEIVKSALVIGGGLSGMTAALELSKAGFDAHLVEKDSELGGLLRRIHYGLSGEDLQGFLKRLVKQVEDDDRIHVYTNAELKEVSGSVGNFTVVIDSEGEETETHQGVIIVATGGEEYEPTEYLYGKDPRVMTQLEFEEKLAKEDEIDAKCIVMVHCVGSRTAERPYCSRVCCTESVKNALRVKEMDPGIAIYSLFRDMRTYGFREEFYREAAEKGVVFVRFLEENEPVVRVDDQGKLEVIVLDDILQEELLINPDYLVLAAATLPARGNEE
ncbi:MAG: CoB--CoM heterodisulfide reductase iron-sulfur subunit A family protein, partial [Thermoplasmata archaeon]|nr:CoB--CoM heterodisulfide reductase iron-sulfur subunit A family protein [Thermoplasmata archaeon]